MLCVQCGTDNPEGGKYCISCSALLLHAAPTGDPSASSLDIEEDVEYPVPEAHYQSPVLQHLAWCVHEFIEEEGEFEPILEAYEAFREIFEGFKSEIPKIHDLCYSQQGMLEGDVMPSQIKYTVSKAETLYSEGETIFEDYFDTVEALHEDDDFPDPQPLIEATRKWLGCNDSVCITYDFLVGRHKALDELSVEYDEIRKEKEAQELADGASSGAGGDAVSYAPSDSTDLA